MATKKTTRRARGAYAPRPDRYSKKKTGTITQSLRLNVADARLIRKAALAQRMSTNLWMTNHLVAAAAEELAEAVVEKFYGPTEENNA